MSIEESINDIQEQLNIETRKMKEQEAITYDLGRKYAEAAAILQNMRLTVQTLNKNLANLIRVVGETKDKPKKDPAISEDNDLFDKLLNEAVDIAISRGLIAESVTTKNGVTLSMRRSAANRAKNSILHSRFGGHDPIETLKNMSTDDIFHLRNAGRKTFAILNIAKEILETERGILVYG